MTILMPVSVVYIIVFSGYQIFTIIYSAKSEIMDRQFFCGARTVIKPQDLFLSTEGPRIQLHTPVCWHQLWDTSHPTASMSRMSLTNLQINAIPRALIGHKSHQSTG